MKTSYETSDLAEIPGAKIAILQSEWYREYSDMMVKHCNAVLENVKCNSIEHHLIPGALELPLAARTVARQSEKPDAIIIIGILLKGETHHFEMIFDITTRGFERVMFEEDIPIIIELLPVTDIEQVKARCADNESNKGREAAIATTKIISWRRSLNS